MERESDMRKKQVSSVGERVRAAREAKEMSQLDVANLLGLSRAAIAQWESNTTSPSLFKTLEAAKILDVSPEWLAFGSGATPGEVPEPSDIVKLPEMTFTNSKKPTLRQNAWAFQQGWLSGDLHCDPTNLAVWTVEGNSMAPRYQDRDRVLIDTSVSRPTPSGVFLHWNGIGPVLNHIAIRPGEGGPQAILTSLDGTEPFTIPIPELQVIGRVCGVLKPS